MCPAAEWMELPSAACSFRRDLPLLRLCRAAQRTGLWASRGGCWGESEGFWEPQLCRATELCARRLGAAGPICAHLSSVVCPATGVPMLSVQPKGKQKGCAGCNRKIKDRYLLKALDKYWHEDCLKCACCDCRLGEVGSTLYTKANLILCRRDYLRWAAWRLSQPFYSKSPHPP